MFLVLSTKTIKIFCLNYYFYKLLFFLNKLDQLYEIWSAYKNRCRRNFEIHKKANINIFLGNINFIIRPKFTPVQGGRRGELGKIWMTAFFHIRC